MFAKCVRNGKCLSERVFESRGTIEVVFLCPDGQNRITVLLLLSSLSLLSLLIVHRHEGIGLQPTYTYEAFYTHCIYIWSIPEAFSANNSQTRGSQFTINTHNSNTYTWSIPEAFNRLKEPTTNDPHGEGAPTVVHNAPWAVKRHCFTQGNSIGYVVLRSWYGTQIVMVQYNSSALLLFYILLFSSRPSQNPLYINSTAI